MTKQFFDGREAELSYLIANVDRRTLDRAPCRGLDPTSYHPDDGPPDEVALGRCSSCDVRLACLAVALAAEEPDMRVGWYGGLGPDDRRLVARDLSLAQPRPFDASRAVRARELRSQGWTVVDIARELGCSRRQAHRYLGAA